MSLIDIGVIVLYIAACILLGYRLGSNSEGLKGYLLGERNIPAWAVMISIVATETSAVTFLSVPSVAYRGDFTFLQLAMGYILARVVVSVLLMPAYFQGEIFTAYQVLAVRFGGRVQKVSSVVFLISRTLASGLRLFLAAKVLEVMTGWPLPTSIVVIGISTVVYTYLGGLKAVVWADVIQFAVYIVGALIALAILTREFPGGWSEITTRAGEAGKFRVFNWQFDLTQTYTFWAGVIGGLFVDTATHGADQMMVQRYLSARSRQQASAALIVSGFVILAQFALFLLIGACLFLLYQDKPPARPLTQDGEFAYFIVTYLPVGIKGVVIAAVFSVTMSTVSGALSASVSSTMTDLYRPLFPQTSDARCLVLSRLLTGVWGVIQMGVALLAMGLQDTVVNNALAVASFVTGILLGVFLLGVLTKRVAEPAALAGMLAGVAAVSAVKFGTAVAWPWYAVVGSLTVLSVGCLAQLVLGPPPNSLAPTAPGRPSSEVHPDS